MGLLFLQFEPCGFKGGLVVGELCCLEASGKRETEIEKACELNRDEAWERRMGDVEFGNDPEAICLSAGGE